jgi:hypothetical protein
MKLHTIDITQFFPGDLRHIKQVLHGRHKKPVTILYRIGSEVTYMVD